MPLHLVFSPQAKLFCHVPCLLRALFPTFKLSRTERNHGVSSVKAHAWPFDGLCGMTINKGKAKNRGPRAALTDDAFWAQNVDLDNLADVPGIKMCQPIESQGVSLLYKPYMDYLWEALISGAPGLQFQQLDAELRLQKSTKGQHGAQVHNWLLCSTKIRRIRLTYFDAGHAVQAFNSLIYPDYRYDFPLLGIDLLSFGNKKLLCVIDFQPLSQESRYLEKYTAHLTPIRQTFAELCSKMTSRFYDGNCFFSKQLIFFRSSEGVTDPVVQVPHGRLFKVYKAYVENYLSFLHALEGQDDLSFMSSVRSMQASYDKYSAERDPAVKLFDLYFGKTWSKQMVDEFLFPLAR